MIEVEVVWTVSELWTDGNEREMNASSHREKGKKELKVQECEPQDVKQSYSQFWREMPPSRNLFFGKRQRFREVHGGGQL